MKCIVTGRVQPERADVYFSRVEMSLGDCGTAIASCTSSQITIALNDPPVDGWISAKLLADDLAQLVVGALGFSNGTGYSAELIQVTEEDGTPHVFGVRPCGTTPEESLGFTDQNDIFNKAIDLSARDVFFRLALRDYMRAIRDERDCATYCYRAIEGIKSAFAYESGRDRWDEMHNALGTNRRTIEHVVKKFADPVRHGNWVVAPPTTGAERWAMLSLTRSILAQYLEHRTAGGSIATPPPWECPLRLPHNAPLRTGGSGRNRRVQNPVDRLSDTLRDMVLGMRTPQTRKLHKMVAKKVAKLQMRPLMSAKEIAQEAFMSVVEDSYGVTRRQPD